jgi:hypothetical protein
MSQFVQHQRSSISGRPEPDRQHWIMLLLESLSVGVLAIFLLFFITMVVVGVYAIVIWPLTFWDLANLGLEKYGSWINTILWSVFAGGSLAGFWCLSGAAFKTRRKARASSASAR